MDYKAMWKEMRDHLKNSEIMFAEIGNDTMKIKSDAAGMFLAFMKVLEQEELYKNVRHNGKVVNYDFQNQG